MSHLKLVVSLGALTLALAACGSPKQNSGAATTPANASACAKADLALHTAGQLTIATDKPAYPPYFEDNKPENGRGFESAVAFAIARQLGFAPTEVKWTTEPFNASYSPGPKTFDFDVNQISITAARAKHV